MASHIRAMALLTLSACSAAVLAAPPVNNDPARTPAEPPGSLTELPAPSVEAVGAEPRPLAELSRPRAVARFEGLAAPGAKVTLSGGESTGQGLRFRWVQTSGPSVALDDPQGRSATFTVPEKAETVGFLLVAANGVGLDSTSVTVPVDPRDRGRAAASGLKADAGDDVAGLVGRQITLNGGHSEPKGKVGYRWLQLGGPKVRLKLEDGYIYSFVPTSPGIYRFALVVAVGSEISEPDPVTVSVGAAMATAPADLPPEASEPTPVDEAARAALSASPGGVAAAGPLADAFLGVSERMDLYRSYADVFQELTHRLAPVLPTDRLSRLAWDERLFAPLTARLIEAMRGEGLDLRLTEGQRAELTAGQRARLSEQFRAMAEGFRATMPAR